VANAGLSLRDGWIDTTHTRTHTHTHTHIVTARILFSVKTTVEVPPTSYLPTASNPLQLELIKLKRAVMF
jgi:hypothetical protein